MYRGEDLIDYQEWLLSTLDETWASFASEFSTLWGSERTGILYPSTLFENQDHSASGALSDRLRGIWADALGFCGIEQHRRTLSLAHNADFESIEDAAQRAPLEARNLRLGAYLLMNRTTIADTGELLDIARDFNGKDAL